MQTHEDDSHLGRDLFMGRLEERAKEMAEKKLCLITAGEDGEPVLDRWEHDAMLVTKRPDDEQDIARISVGGGIPGVNCDYLVFRGDSLKCIELLERALSALRYGRSSKRLTDERKN